MEQIPLLDQLTVIAGLGALVALVLGRLRLPTVAGLLFAGAVVGPWGFGLVRSVHAIEVLAELGVVLLLFTIGLEFSLERLRVIFRQVVLGGSVQVGLTVLVVAGVALALGENLGASVFYGFVFALSSTAIVLRALAERRELDAPHGRFIVGALIFQDLLVVPMVLIVPLLAPGKSLGTASAQIGLALLKAAFLVVAVVLIARLVVPRIFRWVAASRSREIFLLAVLAVCIGTAWLTSLAGLSLALGAFLGGMVVAGTEYGHRAAGDVGPLRDVFVSLFFVSLGMLFDVRVVIAAPLVVLLLLLGFLVLKGFLATIAALLMRFPARAAWLAGVGLAQFGEFGFVLARIAQQHGVIDGPETQRLLAAGILSMFLTPVLARIAPHVAAGESLLAPLEKLIGARGIDQTTAERGHFAGHLIVAGYGVAGKLLTGALERSGFRYLVLELNPETVTAARKEGKPVYYGDAASPEALQHAGIDDAVAVVLLMNDPHAARLVADTATRIAPGTPVLVRSHYLAESARLIELGAADVVVEEVEAGVEMLARVLRRLDVPFNLIEERLAEARERTQRSVRRVKLPRRRLPEMGELADLKVETVLLREGSAAVGRTLRDLDLRRETGALVLATRREGMLQDPPDPDAALDVGDLVFLVGSGESIRRATAVLDRQQR
ncbi:cation:proton antiporter [Vulgatibacter sp.]|uniref:cation:proton antiporter domain-containing protein n=1 Tax=Vulgatibacter sp. TaxID=1971226 RepID=UPI0035632FAC